MASSAAEKFQVEKASVVLPQMPAQNLRKKLHHVNPQLELNGNPR